MIGAVSDIDPEVGSPRMYPSEGPRTYPIPRLEALACTPANADDDLWTYIPDHVPVNISIQFFNVMNAYGSALINRIPTDQTVNITEVLSYWCMRP
jgi:hypothetical protein